MADDLLSAAELETLLAAGRESRDTASASPRPLSPPASPAVARNNVAPIVTPRPPRLSAELQQALATIHERSAAQFAEKLTALVRRAVQVKLLAVSPTTYREFVARLDSPSCFNVLSAAPLEGRWALALEPAILYPLIDCMLGGGRRPAAIAGRPPTDIELRLAARVTSVLVHALERAWRDYVALELAVERVECYPRTAAALEADDGVIWIRFELAVGSARGLVNLALPIRALWAIAARLTGQPIAETENARPPEPPVAAVELVARLAQSKIAAVDAANLRVGDIITTEQVIDAPIAVVEDGVVRFYARAGASGGRKAVEIDRIASEPNDAAPGAA